MELELELSFEFELWLWLWRLVWWLRRAVEHGLIQRWEVDGWPM